jgi:hypothetical protein
MGVFLLGKDDKKRDGESIGIYLNAYSTADSA